MLWCVPEEVNPSGGVDQDHRTRSVRMSSRSPSQPLPRSERASSRSSGTAASLRSARLTASCLVSSLNRAITAAHASSSISIFVRPIHQLYTNRCQLASQLSGAGRRSPKSVGFTKPARDEAPGNGATRLRQIQVPYVCHGFVEIRLCCVNGEQSRHKTGVRLPQSLVSRRLGNIQAA